MFRIGDFSRLAQVSIRMLRHYDKLDLLKPVSIDPDSSYRYYEAKQLHDVKQIQLLQSMGFELKEIKIILASRNEAAELVQIYEKRYQNLLQQAEKIRSQLVRLQEAKPFFETTDDYLVEVKTLPARKVASCRGKIPTYQAEEQLWQQLYEALQRDAVKPSSTLQLDIAVFHDETYQDAFPDIEVQTVISDLGTSDQTITYKKAPEQEIASVTFSGSYEKMPAVTEAAANWLEANAYRLNGPMFNIYHVSPAADPDPEKWLTEACFPITKGAE